MPMIETADNVAERYNVSREAQDEYALRSQQLIAQAQTNGIFKDEIVPMQDQDEEGRQGDRAREHRRLRGRPRRVQPAADDAGRSRQAQARPGRGQVDHGRQRFQLSDGAAAVVIMESKAAEKAGVEPLGRFMGFTVAGCEPDEMGIGPVFAVPRLLERHGLKVEDIDLWELNEAFASQCLYSRDRLGIDPRSTTSTAAPSPSATPTA
jgi:acetyl-CoA C-acetyltransferase